MIRLNELLDAQITASDGQVGRVADFYIDDQSWIVRYIAVRLDWEMGTRTVLVSPLAAGQPDLESHVLPLALSRQVLLDSPEINLQQPITPDVQQNIHAYFNWPAYWVEPGSFGLGVGDLSAAPMVDLQADLREQQGSTGGSAVHLRSIKDLAGYHILAKGGEEIGTAVDFIIDEADWQILYLIVDTGTWLADRQVVLSPAWAERVSWAQSLIYFDLSKKDIEQSPMFDPQQLIQREYEDALYQHYNRQGYW